MKEEKDRLPSCPSCGGERVVEDFDMEKGKATIKELHSESCQLVVKWQKVFRTKGRLTQHKHHE